MKLCVSFLFVVTQCCAIVAAQQKPGPLKFDELTLEPGASYSETMRIVKARADRFAVESQRQPGKLKYLMYYRERVRDGGNYWNTSHMWATSAKHVFSQTGNKYDDRDVLVLDGGVRANETLEFWFVPRGELPTPTAEFERSEAIDCPRIVAYQSSLNFDKALPVELKADAGPDGANSFNWTVSDGKITGPNGWSRVEVDVSTVKTNRLTAFLEVEGIPLPCRNRAIVVAEFGNTARLVDSSGPVPNGDFRARMDSFMAELAKHPEKQAYIYIYGSRVTHLRDLGSRERLIKNHIYSRRFDATRIGIVDAGVREEMSTDFWLVPAGVEAPKPTPSADPVFMNRKPSSRRVPKK